MKRYTIEELTAFLQAVDKHLNRKINLIVIGGTAAALGYKYAGATQDIDTANSVSAELEEALKLARNETGLDIAVSHASVYDPPSDFEDRLVELKDLNLKNLILQVPDALDLALMKIVRGERHDLDAIESIIKAGKIPFSTAVDRFVSEMGAVVKSKRDLQMNFLVMIERCYGEAKMNEAANILGFDF